jgi:hypothetical protein|tara:strand:+ start:1410 stop:1823 length:414 start_codon:yes stop_codon:yes gene_type:complete
MKTQLLCTFTPKNRLDDVLELIIECNDILYDKIYVFQNGNDSSQLICTYNVEYEDDNHPEDIPNTISLHRKKQSNTLYTINALNEVIRSLNGGILDKKFPIPWDDYYNSLLLTNDSGLNKIPTKIHSIVDVKNWKKD